MEDVAPSDEGMFPVHYPIGTICRRLDPGGPSLVGKYGKLRQAGPPEGSTLDVVPRLRDLLFP